MRDDAFAETLCLVEWSLLSQFRMLGDADAANEKCFHVMEIIDVAYYCGIFHGKVK